MKLKDKGIKLLSTMGLVSVFSCVALCGSCAARGRYRPAAGPLMTRWAKQVSPRKALPEYPRPQMVRKEWMNLNGLWEYAIVPKDQVQPAKFDGEILVPFPVESALSGVMKAVGPDNRLWYRRTFKIPGKWKDKRVLLHFGAVDWDATAWVNGKKLGSHRGGYDPFTFEITDALRDGGEQEIVLSVWDPTDAGSQPRGKQVLKPRGIWYTAVTGIWQSVWLEPVPESSIEKIELTPDVDAEQLVLRVYPRGVSRETHQAEKYSVTAEVLDGKKRVALGRGLLWSAIKIKIPDAKLWSPDTPFLYGLKVALTQEGAAVDEVSSYFGMRKIEVKKDESGVNRLFLNNEPLFQFGPLDQGWWPDGLYTAPTDQALKHDIEVLKKLGCNMLRKHVKVEPDRLYYWCDKLGLMVWQDMPSGNNKTDADKEQFELELKRVVTALRNHPCIIMWVPFNEGWGQHKTEHYVAMLKEMDPSRLVDNASGWSDKVVGDVHDIHKYPGPAAPPIENKRAAVLGEFGGLGLPVKGHTWQEKKSWGYRSFKTREELTEAYVNLLARLRPLIAGGLAAAVYTQTSDVEIEVNGLMTYDRAMVKMDLKKAAAAARRLYLPPPIIRTIVPTSQRLGQKWRYTTSRPAAGWEKPDFDDSAWAEGTGGFGTKGTPGSVVRTEWKGPEIWLRRWFELKDTDLGRPHLAIHHDEDAEVYINGRLVASLKGYTTGYVQVELDADASKALRTGRNCIAVHCKQTGGGQYIDLGITDVKDSE